MNIVVPVKLVPDLVEELTVDQNGTALDTTWLRLIISEFDDHAIEQAILLKERGAGPVVVIAPDLEGADDVLYTAAARGADRLIKLVGELRSGANNHALARALTPLAKALQPDLVLTGVQAHNDLDGALGPLLAGYLGMPYVGYVAGIVLTDGNVVVRKEYPGGLIAEMQVALPAVFGVQVADQPPRYVAISRVRQAMQTASIEKQAVSELDTGGGPIVTRMFQPEVTNRASMVEGDVQAVATSLVEILRQLGAV